MNIFIGNGLNYKTSQPQFKDQQDRARLEYSSLYGLSVFKVNVFDHQGLNIPIALINAITLAPMKLVGGNSALVLGNTLKCSWNMTGSKIITHICGPVRPIVLDKTFSVDKKQEVLTDKEVEELLRRCDEKVQNRKVELEQTTKRSLKDMRSTVAVIALGILISPAYRIGTLIGIGSFVAFLIVLIIYGYATGKKSDENSEYGKYLREIHPFIPTIVSPVIEETVFRGALQPLFTVLTRSSLIGNIVQAALFGYVHLSNKHNDNKIQATKCFASGLILGELNNRFGFIAPVAEHIMNNTAAIAGMLICSKSEKNKETDEENKDLELKEARAAG